MTFFEYLIKVQNIELFKRAEKLISQIREVFPHVNAVSKQLSDHFS